MGFIKNYESLAKNENRKVVLDLIEIALTSITPKHVFDKHFNLAGDQLTIQNKSFDLKGFKRVFLLGFGKGSAEMCKIIEGILGERITDGYCIDVVEQKLTYVHATLGTHPLPSQANLDFTKRVIEKLSGLTKDDLVIITTCGGGSVLFEAPHALDLAHMIGVNKALLQSGATISEMNTIRKHLSQVKGGGLAKILYPATVINLLFSDVPGNDLSVIASGPLVKDPTTNHDALTIFNKYHIQDANVLNISDFVETPKENKYFKDVSNILFLSNHTALDAMEKHARSLGIPVFILSDREQGDAKKKGRQLLNEVQPGHMLLAGGETTVVVKGNGKGGRNQTVVLASLPYLKQDWVIASFGTDGWDFFGYAGAIGDLDTVKKTKNLGLDEKEYLDDDNSYEFFQKTGDGIDTGKLESNVSDLYIVYKKS